MDSYFWDTTQVPSRRLVLQNCEYNPAQNHVFARKKKAAFQRLPCQPEFAA